MNVYKSYRIYLCSFLHEICTCLCVCVSVSPYLETKSILSWTTLMSGFISAWSDIGNTYWQSHFHKLTFLQKSKRKTRNWHLNQLGNSLSGKWDILLSISYCALSDVPCRQFSCMERHNKHFHYRIIMIKCKEQYHAWYNAFFVQRITYVCFETK